MKKKIVEKPSKYDKNVKTGIAEICSLKNSLTDLLPEIGYETTQISNLETLYHNNRYSPLSLNRMLLGYLYCEHGIIQTAIEQPVLDALRGGVTINSPELDNTDIEEFQTAMEESGDLNAVQEAVVWEALFGGSALIVNMDIDPIRPWDINKSKPGKLEFYAADRWELSGGMRGGDKDAVYDFYGTKIHRTRIIEFKGKNAPSFIRPQFQGWGMSKIEKMVRDVNAFFKHNNLIFELLDEAKVDVWGIDGFNASLMSAKGTGLIKSRIELANQIKSFNRAIVMDTKDKYDNKQISFSGLSEILKELRIGIASALRMPLTKIFGISSAGFNSGEDDLENYNAMIESEIRQPLRSILRTVISMRMLQLWGYVPKFKFDFKPLRVMSEKDEEDINTARQTRTIELYDRALISSEEVGQMLSSYGLLPVKTNMEEGVLDDHPQSSMSQIQDNLNGINK